MVSATPVVTFYFDYLSPFAYLAETQVHRLDATIDYRPIQTLDVMERVGNTPSFICKAKRRYQGRDAGRWAQRYGVRLARHPDYARIDGRRLLLGALAALQVGAFSAYQAAIFAAVWANHDDLASDQGWHAILEASGLDASKIVGVAQSAEIADRLDRENAAAAEQGVFGVPTFIVDGEQYFGNDRLSFVEEHIERLR